MITFLYLKSYTYLTKNYTQIFNDNLSKSLINYQGKNSILNCIMGRWSKKYYIVLERRIPNDLPEFNFISKCSEKKLKNPVGTLTFVRHAFPCVPDNPKVTLCKRHTSHTDKSRPNCAPASCAQ